MKSHTGRLADLPVLSGIPPGVPDPIKPELFAGKHETQLGRAVGLTQFGVNHVVLEPGMASSLRHWHEGEDEFVFVLRGTLTLVDENGEHRLAAGDFAGFPAGAPNAHHLINRSDASAAFLAVGTRKTGRETIHYPDDALRPTTVIRDAQGNRIAK
ncbi:MAG: cupin domain-containing protein [Rhizomicrobium sp.]